MTEIQYNYIERRDKPMETKFANVLGKAVKTARKKKLLTQKGLSEKTKMSRNYISDIECGRYIPSTEKLILLAKTLDMNLNLLKNDGNTEQSLLEKVR
jgi:transcriptional regulator with XRE-family HTH domain